MNDAMTQVCALARVVAQAIDIYAADTPEGRDELLDYFIGAVKNCLEQQHKDRTLQ